MNADGYHFTELERGFALPRWLIVVAGALLVLIVAGAATLKFAFPPEKLRAMVVPRIEEKLDREVELASVKLKLFPRIAVRLDGLSVANAPGFGAEPMLELEALELDLRLWPLLSREFELGQVRLVRPVVRYQVLEDGSHNFEGLGKAEEAPTEVAVALAGFLPQGEAAPTAGAFFVSDLRVSEGTVHYDDRSADRSATMALAARASVERAQIDDRAMESRGTIELTSIKMSSPQLGEERVALSDVVADYDVFADLRGDSIIVRDVQVAVGELPLAGGGSIHGLKSERRVDFTIESEDVDIASFISSLPAALQARLGDIEASGTARLELSVSGSLAGDAGPDVGGTIEMRDVDATHAAAGALLTGGSGVLIVDNYSASLPAFEGQVMGRPFQLQLAVSDFENLAAEGRVSGALDLAQLAAMKELETPMSGVAAFDIAFVGPAKQPGALRLTGPVQLTDVSYRSPALAVPAEISSATVQLTGDGITSDGIPVRLGSSDLTLTFSAPAALPFLLSAGETGSAPVVEFTLMSEKLDLGELKAESETQEVGYGQLVSARLAGTQVDGREPGELAREKYELPLVPVSAARGRVRIAEFINPPNRARNLNFTLRLRDGVLEILNLRGRSYGGRLSGRMGLDFSGGQPPFPLTYDLKLEDANAAGLLRSWTRLGAPISGKVNIDLNGSAAIDETMLPSTDALLATGSARFSDGRFENFGLTNALANQLRLDPSQFAGFRDFGGPFEIRNGNFVVQTWQLASGDLDAAITGVAGLGGALDLGLDLTVPMATLQKAGLAGGGLGDLLGQLAGSDQSIEVAVGVGGTMSNPVLQLDEDALQQQLGQMLQGQGQDLLNRFLRAPRDTSGVY